MREIAQPSGAVAEMMAAENADRDFGASGEFVVSQPEPRPPAPEPARFPPPDWEAEAQLRAQAEPQAAAPVELEPDQSLEAKPAKKTKKTPRLDRVRQLLKEDRP